MPFAVVPGVYLGAHNGWWGSGLGNGWQYAMAGVLTVAVVVTAVAVAGRFVLRQWRARRRAAA